MFACDICGSAYKRNGTLLFHQRRSKICVGARAKLAEMEEKRKEYEEKVNKKEEEHMEAMKKLKEECNTKIEETNDQRIDETCNLSRELEKVKNQVWYCKREMRFRQKESDMKQDMINDFKNTLLRQSEIIAIGGNATAKKTEPVADITEIQDFKYTSLSDLNEAEKNKISSMLCNTDVAIIYSYLFEKYYIKEPANMVVNTVARKSPILIYGILLSAAISVLIFTTAILSSRVIDPLMLCPFS